MYIKIKVSHLVMSVVVLISLLWGGLALAGDPDASRPPGEMRSFSLADVYNRLTTGVAGSQRVFTEPSSGPGTGTMQTINEIMAVAPALDNTSGATRTEVLAGATYWGLRDGAWGPQTGAMANNGLGSKIVPTTTDQSVAAGYWSTANTVQGDPDLAAGNIASGINLFGVDGSLVGASGVATDGQVLAGVSYSNAGGASTGTMANNGGLVITPATISQSIGTGYHDGSGYVLGDGNLVARNIVSGTTIFGVKGSAVRASGVATDGQVLAGVSYSNAGGASTGAIANNGLGSTIVPTITDQTLAAGYWSTANTVQGDSDLVGSNIAQGVDLFGVIGILPPGSAVVPKTGQKTSDAPGDDGDLERGIAWPDPRFITSTTGIVTDTLTGLIWLQNANCFGPRSWADALSDANGLADGNCGLSDGSSAGDWRLPNVRELHSLVDYGFSDLAVPNTAGTGQWSVGDPFTDIQSVFYWSSSNYTSITTLAWIVDMFDGHVGAYNRTNTYYVWPVRGGQ